MTSWEYSAETGTIESRLDDGLHEAGVELDDGERARLVEEIDEVKQDETRGAPEVESGAAGGGPRRALSLPHRPPQGCGFDHLPAPP